MQYKKQTLPLIVSNYAGLFGIEVKIQGDRAFTDGRSITIPRLQFDSDYVSNLAFAYLAHEAAHIRYSDFDFVKKARERGRLFFYIFNILEDSRVEKLIGRKFIGVYENLFELRKTLTGSDESFESMLNRAPVQGVLLTFLSVACSCCIQKYDLKLNLNLCIKRLVSLNCAQKAQSIYRILAGADDIVESTAASFDLAERIYKVLSDTFCEKTDDGALKSFISCDIENTDTDNSRNCQVQSTDDGCFSDTMTKELSVSIASLDEYVNAIERDSRQYVMPDILRKLENLLNEHVDKSSTSRDDFGLVGESRCKEGDSDFKNLVLKNTIKRRSALVRRVMSLKEQLRFESQRGRKVNIKKVPLIKYGYSSVFLRKESVPDFDTCIQILVDVSGSMLCQDGGNASRAQMACECALSLALALEGFEDLDVGVTYFPGTGCEYETALGFKERASAVASRFDQKPRGSTPLAQALWHALNQSEKQKRSRSIIIVITDGIPDSVSRAREAIASLKRNNIELYGIGINVNAIEEIIEKSVVIQDSCELLGTSFDLFLKLFDRKYYC